MFPNKLFMFDFETFDVDEDGVLNLMEAQHVLRSLGFKGFDAKSVCFSKNVLEINYDLLKD